MHDYIEVILDLPLGVRLLAEVDTQVSAKLSYNAEDKSVELYVENQEILTRFLKTQDARLKHGYRVYFEGKDLDVETQDLETGAVLQVFPKFNILGL